MTIGVTENQIKRFAAEIGIRNLATAERLVTGKSPVRNRGQIEPDHQRMSKIKVRVEADESSLSPEKQRLIEEVATFAQRTSVELQDEMHRLMSNYEANTGSDAFTPEMERKMKERGYDLPRFTVIDGEAAQRFIEEISESEWWKLQDDAVLLIYNPPPLLSRFWHRSKAGPEDEQPVEINEGEVEWGYFYRGITPIVQEGVKLETAKGNLTFDRINRMGRHDPLTYYYAWEVNESKYAGY